MDGTFVCLGVVDHYLALLADAAELKDRAAGHSERAIAINDSIGAIPWSRRGSGRRTPEFGSALTAR